MTRGVSNITKTTEKTVVLYRTKYGSTKRYAAWIAKRTNADIYDLAEFDVSRLEEYSVVLFGSPVYFGKIKYIGFIKRHWNILEKKKTVVFYVTGITADDVRHKSIVQKGLPDEIRKRIDYYPLRGVFDYARLNLFDKLVMSWPRIRLTFKRLIKKDMEAKELLNRFYSPQDWTDEKSVEPITSFIK